MILSRATARTFWGDEDPIGRTVRRVADGKDFTVVGIVGDVRSTTLNRESPALYYSSGSRTWPLMDVVLRTQSDPASIMATVRQKIRALDPELPLSNIRPMTEWVSTSAAQPRLNATLLGVFACVALLVAAIGTYGVLAYSVSQRTKELGLRMALGADRAGVLQLIVREGMTVGITGIIVGILAADRDQPDAVSSRVRRLCLGSHDVRGGVGNAGGGRAACRVWCPRSGRRGSIRWKRCVSTEGRGNRGRVNLTQRSLFAGVSAASTRPACR